MDVIAGLNCDDQFAIYTNIKLLYCTPETHIRSYLNHIQFKKQHKHTQISKLNQARYKKDSQG